MSLYGAMFSGVSALNAQSQALGMIADNISNVNTVGYKTTSASFSTLVTRQTTNFYAPGGVRSVPVASIDRQGLLQTSSNPTDMAISGSGFFVTANAQAPTASDARNYTRAGQFTTDSSGYLRTPNGHYLQGWATDSSGVPTTANTALVTNLESVRVSGVSGSAVATSAIDLGLNLPASAANGSTQTTNMQIFDSLGVPHDVEMTWTKNSSLNWTLTVNAVDSTTPAGFEDTSGGNTPFSMLVVFNSDGTINNFDGSGTAASATPNSIYFPGWTSGASPSTITLALGTAGAIGTAQADGVTQYSSAYSVGFANQNGVQFGNFYGVSVDEDGIISALYDNGETLKIYKLPIATFPNPNGLDAQNGTAFTESDASGGYFLREAGTANAGSVVSSALEASNADIAKEFTDMIVTQRAYSAATRVITTADEMLDELIRIKR